MNVRQISRPKPIVPSEILSRYPRGQAIVINAAQPVMRFYEQPAQSRVVNIAHDVIVEKRFVASIEEFVGQNSAQFAMCQDLESQVGMLDLSRQAQKEFP